MWLCIFLCKRFEDTFEYTQWRKIKQMQPMWLCLFSGKSFEDTFENTQWRKIKQMQPMQCDFASSTQKSFNTGRLSGISFYLTKVTILVQTFHPLPEKSKFSGPNIFTQDYLFTLQKWQFWFNLVSSQGYLFCQRLPFTRLTALSRQERCPAQYVQVTFSPFDSSFANTLWL